MHDNSTKKAFVVYTRFASSKVTQGAVEILDLKQFAQEAARSYKSKHAQPLCVPDQLPDNSRASGVEPIVSTSVFLDFDKPALTPAKMARLLEGKGLAYCLYPTYSWTKACPKYRVVLPLKEPMQPEERRKMIAGIMKVIPGIAPESLDNKRGYFVGRNGSTSFAPMWKYGKTAEQHKWPDAVPPASRGPERVISLRDNPARLAQDRFAELGHKLKDGEGRWQCVEYLATRVSARQYDEDKSHTFLNDMIARYFDASEVTSEDRKKWEARITHWRAKDMPRREHPATRDTEPRKMPQGLPETFSIDALLDMKLPPTQWIVDELLPPGLAMLAGPPKIGKSQVALDLSLAVAAGKPFLDKFSSRKSKVIYYDLESGHHLLQERVVPLMKARKHTKHDLTGYLSFSLITDQGADAMKQLRADLEANSDVRLVVVDIFARMRDLGAEAARRVSSYLLEYEVVSKFQDICQEYPNLCILLVHHTNKKSADQSDHWQDSISGTQGIAGGTHTNILLQRPVKQGLSEEEREALSHYIIMHAAGKRVKDTSWTLMKTGDGCTWSLSDRTPAQVRSSSLQQEIMAVLEGTPERLWSSPEIADELGKNRNTVREIMRRMARQKMIVSPTGKGYCLPQDEAKEKTQRPKVGRRAATTANARK